jgi:hypothetical protein
VLLEGSATTLLESDQPGGHGQVATTSA